MAPTTVPRRRKVTAALVLVLLAGCGGDAEERVAVDCDVPRLATDAARPLEWIGVAGLPEGLGPAVAEVRAPTGADGDEADVLPTFVRNREDGTTELQVPIHPSFRLAGGEVTVRVYSEAVSCDPVPLTIMALEPAPGAMTEAAEELRATMDEILAAVAAELSAADRDDVAATLARRGGELPLLSIAALWALPELERLEDLLAADAPAEMSPADAEMLDAIAGRLELAERMRDFRDLVLIVRELTGEPVVTVAAEAQISGVRPDVASPFQFASHAPGASVASASASVASASASMPARQPGSCLEGRANLFDIAEPAELDNLMRAQDYAERFLAGANDQEGGSASGTVFGDIGAVAGWVEIAGKAGEMASSVWDAFSTVVLNTAEAYTGLLPGEMELTVMVDPSEFEEDSEETGRWTASTVAASDGLKLTEKVIEKVMETALEKGLAEASIGKELTDGPVDDSDLAEELHEDVADKIDEQLLEKPTSGALDALLESIGAKEVEGGFDIPGGCWSLNDMSASDAPPPGSGDGEGGSPEGGSPPPPLVTGHLSGGAVEFTDGGEGAAREYEPVEAGTSRLEIRTAENYRKTAGSIAGLSVGTTYAFGGDQYTAVTRITVNEIEVQINPTIIRVEPGDRVDFVATVRNALDTRVKWSSSANPLDETVDFGDGTHEAVLLTPDDPSLYPIEVEIESVSRGGARADGVPVRKATAKVQLADPVIEIQPPGGCIVAGERRQFVARVFGVENQTVEWDHEGVGKLDDGSFRASGTGRATIRATWVEDPDVSAEVDVQVADECGSHFTYTVGGALRVEEEGELWGITGIPGSMAPAHLNATDGQCLMTFAFEAEPGMEGPVGRDAEVSLSLTAAFTGVPREQSYVIGRRPRTMTEGPPSISVPVAPIAWREEIAQPDRVFASLGVGMKIDNDGLADGFTSQDGQFVIDYFDGERIEGRFNVSLEETEIEYPHTTEQRYVTVTGRFSHPLNTGAMDFPDYYYCGTD